MAEYDDYDPDAIIYVENRSAGFGTLLGGIAIGAAITLLFAPESGPETRRRIRSTAVRAKDAVGESMDNVVSSVTGGVDRVRESMELKKRQISRAVEAGRAAAEDARTDLENRIAETKAAYKEI
jgi:gas vesicle protein